jgi:hypothetical protein
VQGHRQALRFDTEAGRGRSFRRPDYFANRLPPAIRFRRGVTATTVGGHTFETVEANQLGGAGADEMLGEEVDWPPGDDGNAPKARSQATQDGGCSR